MRLSSNDDRQSALTVGELCEALTDGEISARVEEGAYLIAKRDLISFALPPDRDKVVALSSLIDLNRDYIAS